MITDILRSKNMKYVFRVLLVLLSLSEISSHARDIVIPVRLVGAGANILLQQVGQQPAAPGEEIVIEIERRIDIPDDAIGAINRLRELIQIEEQVVAQPLQQNRLKLPMALAALPILRAELAAEEKRAAEEQQIAEEQKRAADEKAANEKLEGIMQFNQPRVERKMGKPGGLKTPRRKY
jgi:hypothetical protein